jgi:hypothetical protein
MTPLVRALAILLVILARPVRAEGPPSFPDSAQLEFHGFRAGARLDELQATVRRLDGGRLRCDRAKRDPRVSECRAVVNHPELGAVDLWVSAMDSSAGVITISRSVDAELLARWRQTLERRYGKVDATAQGSQWMMQWVRSGRMLRLTWRLDKRDKVASVSLVDGHVLDEWGRHQPSSSQ